MAGSPPASVNGSFGMTNISINKNRVHPEQWTLPGQWNIEKREMFENWKLDLQSQIVSLDRQLYAMTAIAPQPDVGVYPPKTSEYDEDRLRRLRDELRGRMQTGVRRS